MRYLSVPALLSTAAFLAAGCSTEPPTSPPAVVAIAYAPAASGDGQSGTVGEVLGQTLRVLVTRNSLPAEGVNVQWAVSPGDGVIAPSVATTGADGIAVASWTLPTTSGTLSATATLNNADGSPVTFTATATAGPATTFDIRGGNNQVLAFGETTDGPLTVGLKDTYGNPVEGGAVNWSVFSGTVTLSTPSSTTGANGTASVYVTAGNVAGPVVIRAIPSVALPELDFDLTVTP